MPHIVLENAQSVIDCFEAVNKAVHKIEGGILKITDKYINHKGDSAFLESVAVESGKAQSFFIQLSLKQDAVTVRLLPQTDPQKTKGVKQLMGIVAGEIKSSNPNIAYGKTNLQDFLV